MATTTAVFQISSSLEDDRPEIEFDRPAHENIDWGPFNDIEAGSAPADTFTPIHFFVPEADATCWDRYSVAGTLGLFSEGAVASIGRPALRMFHLLPAFVNSSRYFFLTPREKLECFDRNRAEVVPFPSDPSRIMLFKRYAFRLSRIIDPLVFCIPEDRSGLFATDSVERSIRQSGLKGIRCERVS